MPSWGQRGELNPGLSSAHVPHSQGPPLPGRWAGGGGGWADALREAPPTPSAPDRDKTCGPARDQLVLLHANTVLSSQMLIGSASLGLCGRGDPRGRLVPPGPCAGPGPGPGPQQPLRAVSSASAPVTGSPHSMSSDHVIVLQVTYFIFSPTFPGKPIPFARSLMFVQLPVFLRPTRQPGLLAAGRSMSVWVPSFLATFLVRKLDAQKAGCSFDAGRASSGPDPHSHVCTVLPAQSSSPHSGRRQRHQQWASWGRPLSPQALPWVGSGAGLCGAW